MNVGRMVKKTAIREPAPRAIEANKKKLPACDGPASMRGVGPTHSMRNVEDRGPQGAYQMVDMGNSASVRLPERTLRKHLQPIRGIALSHAIYAALEVGLIDQIAREPRISVAELALRCGLASQRVRALMFYFQNEGLVEIDPAAHVSLTPAGTELLSVRPWYQLLVGGYSATFGQLSKTLRDQSLYATRDGASVAVGSCGISQFDALPMVRQLLLHLSSPLATLVDIGCGDGSFLGELARDMPGLQAIGIEPDAAAREAFRNTVDELRLTNLISIPGGATDLPDLTPYSTPRCLMTAFVLQEVLEQEGRDFAFPGPTLEVKDGGDK